MAGTRTGQQLPLVQRSPGGAPHLAGHVISVSCQLDPLPAPILTKGVQILGLQAEGALRTKLVPSENSHSNSEGTTLVTQEQGTKWASRFPVQNFLVPKRRAGDAQAMGQLTPFSFGDLDCSFTNFLDSEVSRGLHSPSQYLWRTDTVLGSGCNQL